MQIKLFLYLPFIVFVFQYCSGKQKEQLTEREIHETEEALVGVNRLLVQKDKEKILAYIQNNNLVMNETPSGLWIGIRKQGTGKQVLENNMVTLNYKVSLLDGTICYDSDSLGVKKFVTGKGGVESGLEEGILLLNVGSAAVMIMPPHLAHGLQGDGNRIPARSIIVYEVELLKAEPL